MGSFALLFYMQTGERRDAEVAVYLGCVMGLPESSKYEILLFTSAERELIAPVVAAPFTTSTRSASFTSSAARNEVLVTDTDKVFPKHS